MSLEDLIKTLEAKLPGFSYTVFSHGPGMPVMLRWDHRSPALQKREAVLTRSIVAKDIKSGFEQVLTRYVTFEEEDRLRKLEDERQVKLRKQAELDRAVIARAKHLMPSKTERRKKRLEGVEDEGVGKPQTLQDVAENVTLTRRSPVSPE